MVEIQNCPQKTQQAFGEHTNAATHSENTARNNVAVPRTLAEDNFQIRFWFSTDMLVFLQPRLASTTVGTKGVSASLNQQCRFHGHKSA